MLADLSDRNALGSDHKTADEPWYVARLLARQSPEFFWIGCCDSRLPANVVAGRGPSEAFVHRTVAHVIHSPDMSRLSALDYAVNPAQEENGVARRDKLAQINGFEGLCRIAETPIVQHACRVEPGHFLQEAAQ